jgi:putative membrane protein
MTETVVEERRNHRIRNLNIIAWSITVVVWLLVGAMRQYKIHVGVDLSFLAGLNALFNTGVTVALLAAFYFIKNKQIERHRKSIYVALTLSAGFLISYVGYHFTNEEIRFCKEGLIKSVYYFILFSHIFLAGTSLPFILMTFIKGYMGDYVRHVKLSKWVFWVWLYVAVTGPVVYLFLLPCR